MKNKKGAHSPLKTLKRLLGIIFKKYWLQLIIVIICICITSFSTVYGTNFNATLIDTIIPKLQETYKITHSVDTSYLWHQITPVIIFYAIGVIASYINARTVVSVANGVLKNVRDEMFEHMQSLPIMYFDRHTHGEIMSRYTNDTDTLRQMIGQSMPQLVNSAVTIVSVFVSMIILNIPLTILTVIMVGFMMFTTGKVASKAGTYFGKQQKSIGELNGFIEEMMEGQKVVKVFCHENESIERFNELNEELFDSANNANGFANILMPINNNLGNLGYVVCAIFGSILAIGGIGSFTLGGLASFLQLNKSFTQPISQVSQQLNAVVMALAGAERVFNLMDEKPEVDDGCVTLVNAKEDKDGNIEECEEHTGVWAWKYPRKDESTTLTKLQGNVVFNDVDFGYNEEKTILHNIKLYAEPGQKIAFVGATGAGKTTITNLINRFYDIQDGKIRYDGININKIKKADLRRSLGIVLQDTHLFTGTVADNIRYGKLDATDEQVKQAAKAAHVDHFIKTLPSGYDMVLNEEASNVSQGQKQLLTIARAILADPEILILDEATSSVDTRTEVLIQKAMDNLMENRTSFIIAHRLSTIRNADLILVMKDGDIIEQGTHEELLAQDGFYTNLYNSQFDNDEDQEQAV